MKTVYLVEFEGSWTFDNKLRMLKQAKLVQTKKAAEQTRFKWRGIADTYTKTITEFKRWRKVIT